jgi:hypothetical protein
VLQQIPPSSTITQGLAKVLNHTPHHDGGYDTVFITFAESTIYGIHLHTEQKNCKQWMSTIVTAATTSSGFQLLQLQV